MANTIEYLFGEIRAEFGRATTKFPTFPTDPLHAVAVVGEEAGELTKAVLQCCYEPKKSTMADVHAETIQVAAMAIRFLLSMKTYDFKPGEQHKQDMN